jgi:hypothetical protein
MNGQKAKPSLGPGMFHWDQHYLTELPGIDAQHHGLVTIINLLGNLLFSMKTSSWWMRVSIPAT